MPSFLVRDARDSDDTFARELYEASPAEAAIVYASNDTDWLAEGEYTYRGKPLSDLKEQGCQLLVRNVETGEVVKFRVGVVEFDPIFNAVSVPLEEPTKPEQKFPRPISSEVTEEEAEMMLHAIGVKKRDGDWSTPYRNYYSASVHINPDGPTPFTIWQGLVARGLAYVVQSGSSTRVYSVSISGLRAIGYREEVRIV